MGWENVFHCEWNKFGQAVLKHHFPNSISYDDITKTDFTIHRGGIDILTGGFPCQPYSTAGKRLGKDDSRHLWPEMLRAIREIKPTWVVGENVRGLLSWNGGMVFNEVQSDLEAEGYDVIPLLLPACGVNAPHRRDRIWFVAHAKGLGRGWGRRTDGSERGNIIQQSGDKRFSNDGTTPNTQSERDKPSELKLREISQHKKGQFRGGDSGTFEQNGWDYDAYPSSIGLERECRPIRELERQIRFGSTNSRIMQHTNWQNFPTQSPIRRGDDGLSDILDADAVLKATGGRKAESNWVKESIKAYGNAVVPQVVYQIFKAIDELNKTT